MLSVYAHPDSESWDEIRTSVRTANGLQSYFKCSLNELRAPLSASSNQADINAFESALSHAAPPVSGLVFCEEQFRDAALIVEILPKRVYVSCGVPKGLEAPRFRLYLLYQIAAAALTLGAQLSHDTNRDMIHEPPVGCLWDWWKDTNQRATAMMMARICPLCEDALRTHGGLPREAIVAARQILDYVRRSMLGESPTVANKVFIAYGHTGDWQVLTSLLKAWGLEPDYFDREAVAGLMVAERWQQMLDQSRFAFAIMTPDDELTGGKRQARQSVVHEIGLCHARMGLRNTAILLAEGTESFSNIAGVRPLSFQSGNLLASSMEIHKLLKDRGILDPDHKHCLPPDAPQP